MMNRRIGSILIIGLLYALGILNKKKSDGSSESSSSNDKTFELIYNLVLYIPCLIIDSMEFLGKEYESSKRKVIIVLMIEMVLILSHILIPELIKASFVQSDCENLFIASNDG